MYPIFNYNYSYLFVCHKYIFLNKSQKGDEAAKQWVVSLKNSEKWA